MKSVEVKLNANIEKVINLIENEVIGTEEGKKLLEQFKKEDFIEHILKDLSYDGIDDAIDNLGQNTDEDFIDDEDSVDELIEEQKVKESKNSSQEEDLDEDDEEEFDNSLDDDDDLLN